MSDSLCGEEVRTALGESEAVQHPLLAVLVNTIQLAGGLLLCSLAQLAVVVVPNTAAVMIGSKSMQYASASRGISCSLCLGHPDLAV